MSKRHEIQEIKEKIKDFVLNIPLEKWIGVTATINCEEIKLIKDFRIVFVCINGEQIIGNSDVDEDHRLVDLYNLLKDKEAELIDDKELSIVNDIYKKLTTREYFK